MKRIVVLGSTGSIGRSTLEVIQRLPGEFEVVGLSAYRSVEVLYEQILTHRPRMAAVVDEQAAERLRGQVAIPILSGESGLLEVAAYGEADVVVNGLVGAVGLQPTLKAIESGSHVAIANKESLVMAGELVIREAHRRGVDLLPVDSEHSAIWQCVQGNDTRGTIKRLILTASGGPFVDWPMEKMKDITPEEALAHPTWKMGRKITIDCATMMNKGLEIIEAHWLFGCAVDRIDVVIHRQSIVHSFVEFVDGAMLAQLSLPDMRIPIQYALMYPHRRTGGGEVLDLIRCGALSFSDPDMERFPCLLLAREAARVGGTMPVALNAANEVAVRAFLSGRISFLDLPRLIEEVMSAHAPVPSPTLEEVWEADRWSRDVSKRMCDHGL